jgi:cobalamin biosynthesis protein CobD/CbiB
MNKQTKQAMAVAAGVLALVGLQSITVPVPSSYPRAQAQMNNDAIGDGVMRSRKRLQHYVERDTEHPLRARAARNAVLAGSGAN